MFALKSLRSSGMWLLMGLSIGLYAPAHAASYDFVKISFWDTAGAPADAMGGRRHSLHVFAADEAQGAAEVHDDERTMGMRVPTQPKLWESLMPERQTRHARFTEPVPFAQSMAVDVGVDPPPPSPPGGGLDLLGGGRDPDTAGLGNDTGNGNGNGNGGQAERFQLTASSGRADSVARVKLRTAPPGTPVGLGYDEAMRRANTTAGIIRTSGHANVVGESDDKAVADSFAAGDIRFRGGRLEQGEKVEGMFRRFVGNAIFGFLAGHADESEADQIDPLTLMLVNEFTGEILREETLHEQLWSTQGPGFVEWSLSGLHLSVRAGGEATVSHDTLSDWVLNPVDGSATLTDGELSTSGALAGLDWTVTTSGDRTSAFLPSSEFSPFLDFDILASGLTDLPEEVGTQLRIRGAGFAAEASVPEPQTVWLLAMGLLAILFTRGTLTRTIA